MSQIASCRQGRVLDGVGGVVAVGAKELWEVLSDICIRHHTNYHQNEALVNPFGICQGIELDFVAQNYPQKTTKM